MCPKRRRRRAINEVEGFLRARTRVEYEIKRGTELGELPNIYWLLPGTKPIQTSRIEIRASDPGNAANLQGMEELDISNLSLGEEIEREMAEEISLAEEHADIEGQANQADEMDKTSDENAENIIAQDIPTPERSTAKNRTVDSNFTEFTIPSVKQANPGAFAEDCHINIGGESGPHAFFEDDARQSIRAFEEVSILVPNNDLGYGLQAMHVVMVFLIFYLVYLEMVTWWMVDIA